ncbi:MAG: DUF202 domain-containing protein [Candidatus Woesearchaeota archaeon]
MINIREKTKKRKTSNKTSSIENIKIDNEDERTQLAEERTLLSYIRTALAILGVGLIIAKMYIDGWWLIMIITILLFAISIIIIYEEVIRIKHLRKHRFEKLKRTSQIR